MASRALSAQTFVSQRQRRAGLSEAIGNPYMAIYLCFALFTGKTGCRDLLQLRNRPCWTSWRNSATLAVRNKGSKHLRSLGQRRAAGIVGLRVLTVWL